MRRMGAVRCSASHQLVSALTTSAIPRMVSEMAGKLSAPKMLGRRGVVTTVYIEPSGATICGAAREGRKLPGTGSRLMNSKRRGGAFRQPAAENVLTVGTDDEELAIDHGILVLFQPALQRADAAASQNLRRLDGHGGTALILEGLVFPGSDGERGGDAAADDERHREQEQQENPEEEAMHAPR